MMNSGNYIGMTFSRGEILDRAFLLSEQLAGLFGNAAAEYGLTFPRLQVLFVLGHEGESMQRELAYHLDCSPRQITALVDALVESGHVVRTTPPEDRRVRLVSLTEKSRVIVDEVLAARVALADELFEGVDDDELQAFGAISERLIVRLGGPTLSRLTGA